MAQIKTLHFGTKDMTDPGWLNIGNGTCEGFTASGLSYGRVVQGLVDSNAHPSQTDAAAFVAAAVNNLCPTQKGQLP